MKLKIFGFLLVSTFSTLALATPDAQIEQSRSNEIPDTDRSYRDPAAASPTSSTGDNDKGHQASAPTTPTSSTDSEAHQ